MIKPNTTRHGWRQFICSECGCKWEQTTRDWLSQSGDDCPYCEKVNKPVDGRNDRELELDRWGEPVYRFVILEPGIVPDAEQETQD